MLPFSSPEAELDHKITSDSSVPKFSEFNPELIESQINLISDVIDGFDYDLGVHEVLLSGSVGSAKSLVAAHLIVSHCLRFKKAHVGIGRKSMPNLKDTLLAMIIDHIDGDVPYKLDKSRGIIKFKNGSKITCVSWADKNYKKVRSYAFSAFVIEEQTENDNNEHYKEIIRRLGRVPHIKESWMISPTNPDSPAHWAHEYFIEGAKKYRTRHVYYSLTEQNPFLKPSYIQKLKETMSKKEADRMLRGMWVEVDTSRIYHNYQSERNFLRNTQYEINPNYPVDIMFDFNVSDGKPFSVALGQAIGKRRHIFKEFHIEGLRTHQMMDEIQDWGIFELNLKFRVFGDASGKNKDTRSLKSDYDIIKDFLNKFRRKNGTGLLFEMKVPLANPPLRRRHNLINGLCQNELEQVRFYVYKGCDWVDKGFRLTAPVKGSDLIENDKLPQQHVTTAIGYWCDYIEYRLESEKSGTIQL